MREQCSATRDVDGERLRCCHDAGHAGQHAAWPDGGDVTKWRQSGRTTPHAARAAGRVPVQVVLARETVDALDELRGADTRTAYLEALILRTAKRKQKST